jgi:hypothetical protein
MLHVLLLLYYVYVKNIIVMDYLHTYPIEMDFDYHVNKTNSNNLIMVYNIKDEYRLYEK